ncbi:hypothetical protein LQ384_00990, partial [Rhodococcus rhodochrous]
RDPHLGKVMRYQLRYIRIRTVRRLALRGAVQNSSRASTKHTNPQVNGRKPADFAKVTGR